MQPVLFSLDGKSARITGERRCGGCRLWSSCFANDQRTFLLALYPSLVESFLLDVNTISYALLQHGCFFIRLSNMFFDILILQCHHQIFVEIGFTIAGFCRFFQQSWRSCFGNFLNLKRWNTSIYISELVFYLWYCLLNNWFGLGLLIDYLFVVCVDIFHLLLKVLDDVFDIIFSLTYALCVVLAEFEHDSQHSFFALLVAEIVESLDFHETAEVIIAFFQVDQLYEVVFRHLRTILISSTNCLLLLLVIVLFLNTPDHSRLINIDFIEGLAVKFPCFAVQK